MSCAVVITRPDKDAPFLRRAASRCRDGRVACRLLALADLLSGGSRGEAASRNGMDPQTLRDWIHRYNAGGIDALSDAPRQGRPRLLTEAQRLALRDLVLAGPDPERDGVVRWRCPDLQRALKARHQVDVHERTVAKWLRQLGLTRLQPRPFHPGRDDEAQAAFKKTFPIS